MRASFISACLGALLSATNAAASPFTLAASYQYGLSADGQGFSSGIQNLGPVTQDLLEVPTVHLLFPGRYGSASSVDMAGSATAGTLRGIAQDAADVRGADPLLGTIGANGFVQLEVNFVDTLTFQSATLAPGTPIEYSVEYVLDSVFTENIGGQPCGPTAPTAQISLDNFLAFGSVQMVNTICNPNGHQVATSIMSSSVGGDALVSERLRIITDARNLPGAEYQALGADASNTAHLFVTVNTPGVTFTSASGADYAAPTDVPGVPEPASLTLLGGGLLELIRRRRRHA